MTKETETKIKQLSEKIKRLDDAAVDKASVFVDGMIALAAEYKKQAAAKAEKQD